METRGISLICNQKEYCLLRELLSPINISDFFWYRPIDQEEVWSRPERSLFFTKDYYSGAELKQLIAHDHFVVFLRLEAYPKEANITRINTFADFSKSPCQIILLIYDCEYVEFYLKDTSLAVKLYSSLKNRFATVRYITSDNDSRTGMNVL